MEENTWVIDILIVLNITVFSYGANWRSERTVTYTTLNSRYTKINTKSIPSRRCEIPGLVSGKTEARIHVMSFVSKSLSAPCCLSLGDNWQRLKWFWFFEWTQILMEFHAWICAFFLHFCHQGFMHLLFYLKGKGQADSTLLMFPGPHPLSSTFLCFSKGKKQVVNGKDVK